MLSKYQMWMTHNGGRERLQFPVLPDVIHVKRNSVSISVNIQGLGEVIIKDDPQSPIVSFSSFFPANMFPGVNVNSLVPPNNLVDQIVAWQNSAQPVRWFVTGMTPGEYFRIETFSHFEKGGDVGTIHFTIALKQYRAVKVRQVQVTQGRAIIPPAPAVATPAAPAPVRVSNIVAPRTYTVVRGDTLWGIAARHLGNGARWPEIHNLNRGIISNPNIIFPGQVLVLPS